MKRVIAFWFVMIMLTCGIIGFMVSNVLVEKTGVKADTEPNNNFEQAELIEAGIQSGSLISPDTADVYKFNVTGGQTIAVKFTSSVTGTYAQQMGLHNQTQAEVLHLSSKNNVTNTGTYNVSSSVATVYFYIMVNVGPPGQEAWGNYSFQLQIGTAGNETETAALAATWLKELNISPQIDGNFCGMNAYDLQLGGWGTDAEIRGCIISKGVSGFYSNTTVYSRAMEILNATYYEKTKWMVDGGMGLSRDVASVFAWNLIQPTKGGEYYFSVPDRSVSSAQSMNANTIGSIMPIAMWDQHDAGNMPNSNTIELYQNGSFFCIGNTTGPIGNLSAYADFIKATVERYDCDGIGDMPGLKYGIKYWEVWNEPESPGGGFGGKPGNYTQLLNATYNAVKSACADAIVVSGGALEVYNLTITQQFWEDVFALGGGNYFDIMNIHYNTERNEQAHANFTQYNYTIEFFRNLTSSYGMLKPMWLTEIGTYTGTPLGYGGYLPYQSEQFQASWMVKHYVYGLGKNVTKFFWDLQVAPGDSVFFTNEEKCQLCYYTHKLMIYKLSNFTSVEKLAEGQYKFIVNGKNVYVLWGNGNIPSEITGTVSVTNIFGNITEMNASTITLSDEPVFVEGKIPSNVGLNFTAESGIRVSGGSVPCIVQLPSGVYRLFYTYNGEIYSASSTNGLDFTVDPGKRIAKGGASDPDQDSASSPVSIQFAADNFTLFYEGVSGSAHVVLSANSTDGLNFTKQSGIRYSGGAADGGIVSAFDIIKESTAFLRMYYVGDWFGKNNVRTAVSNDGGNTWTFEQGNICGDDDAGGGPNTYVDPDIVKLLSGGYKLYTKKGADKIYSFSSTDGLSFTQDDGVRLQASQFAGLGVTDLLDPDTIILPNGSMRMFCGAGTVGIVSALSTAYTPHAPISINYNPQFIVGQNGVTSGNGTQADPYIIENWDINASTANGIEIRNTSAYFVIRNCCIYDGKSNYKYGVYFYNVINGKIENCQIYNNSYGIVFDSLSSNNIISANQIYNNSYGIGLGISSSNNISACTIYNNYYGVFLWVYSSDNQIINCVIYNNFYGIYANYATNPGIPFSSYNDIHYNNIYNNTNYGVYNYISDYWYCVNATYNWWGSASGPYHSTNPSGTGDNVSDNVLYDPWLNAPVGVINLPPSINITYPINGQTVNRTITITGNASDPDNCHIEKVEVKIDDEPWQLAGTFDYIPYAMWFYEWNTTTVANGWHTIYARAYDGIDYSEIKSVNVNVSNPIPDTEPPQISNVNDVPDPQEVYGYVDITCTVTDNTGVNVVKVNITYPNGTTKNITMMKVGTNSYSYNTSYSVLGDYSYYIWADDISNNQNKSATYTFSIQDIAEPSITNIQATPTIQIVGGYVNITCTVTDNVAVDKVCVNITGPAGFTPVNITMIRVTGTNNYYHTASYSVEGTYNYYTWANDTSNNQVKSSAYQFIITTQDTTKPVISNVQAAPSTQTQGGYVNITCTATDNVAVDNVCVDITGPAGFTPINATITNIAGTNNYYYNLTYSIPGNYSYYIWANDTSNNQNKSSTYQFVITISAVPVPISVIVTVDDRDINITALGTGTINVFPVALPQAPPENVHYIGLQINVTITGTLTYANITIKYNTSDVENIDESKLRMYYWDGSQWQLCNNTGVDTLNNIVWANVTHLTIFAPMAEKVAKMEAPPLNWLLYIGILAAAIIIVIAVVVIARFRRKQQ